MDYIITPDSHATLEEENSEKIGVKISGEIMKNIIWKIPSEKHNENGWNVSQRISDRRPLEKWSE